MIFTHSPRFFIFLILLLTSIFQACSTEAEPPKLNLEGQFQKGGLSNLQATVLLIKNSYLYVGTNKGLWKKRTGSEMNDWTSLGLRKEKISDFIVWKGEDLLVGIPTTPDPESISIYRTWNGGKTWIPHQNGFGGKYGTNHLKIIEMHPEDPSVLYTRGDANVVVSADSGKTWELLKGSWQVLAAGYFLTIYKSNPKIIWAGGQTALFAPTWFKSTNGGKTWQGDKLKFEAGAYDLIIHQKHKGIVLIAMGRAGVRKSTDGGKNWYFIPGSIFAKTLEHSAQNPQVVYASGINRQGTLFFTGQ